MNECTPLWPAEAFFQRLTPNAYDLTKLNVSPDDLGMPCRRPRVYSMARSRSLTQLAFDLGDAFDAIACCNTVMSANDFFRAPPEVTAMRVQAALAARGITADLQTSGRLGWKVALTFPMKERVRSYQELYTNSDEGFLCNLTQNASYVGRLQVLVPTLMRSSHIYNLELRRPLLDIEQFCVNGVPLFCGLPEEVMAVPESYFVEMPAKVARRLAGNMMNIPVVGVVIATLVLGTCGSS